MTAALALEGAPQIPPWPLTDVGQVGNVVTFPGTPPSSIPHYVLAHQAAQAFNNRPRAMSSAAQILTVLQEQGGVPIEGLDLKLHAKHAFSEWEDPIDVAHLPEDEYAVAAHRAQVGEVFGHWHGLLSRVEGERLPATMYALQGERSTMFDRQKRLAPDFTLGLFAVIRRIKRLDPADTQSLAAHLSAEHLPQLQALRDTYPVLKW